MLALALTLHLLAAVTWVGGMFFAHMLLRPVAAQVLEPASRLSLWAGLFKKFFAWVWVSIGLLWSTGLWLLFTAFGGMKLAGLYIHLMLTTGLVMTLVFSYLFFRPYPRLRQAVAIQEWPAAAEQLAKIRLLVTINLSLGLLTLAIAASGPYWGL